MDAPADALVRTLRQLIIALPGKTGFGATAVLTNSCGGGAPRGRLQQVLDIAEDFSQVKLVTWDQTRKVKELAVNPNVTLFWTNPIGDMGWVSATGKASLEAVQLVDKAGQPYGGLNIVVAVERLEALNYEPSIMADANGEGWIPQVITRESGTWRVVELQEYGYDPEIASPVRTEQGVPPGASSTTPS
ncbi:unnamed protein product [Polarella glacialis]|uniref:Pyridoxal 5'-phosphate synthase n=1 Tax=Polarella glacialis TaxID=89957 RepID=A0A813GNA4_POLGL|nr:unnamed protein product [Polarella glacialis]CAE8657796.1 unnamed protein product [Polarella glacialis]